MIGQKSVFIKLNLDALSLLNLAETEGLDSFCPYLSTGFVQVSGVF